MKVKYSEEISAFGGLNFVFEFFKAKKLEQVFSADLPQLPPQSVYSWTDNIYSLFSIFYCGGDCVEDLGTHLKGHFDGNPFISLPSPDTVLRRLKELAVSSKECQTKRGAAIHKYNYNELMTKLNMKVLNFTGAFDAKELILDYDNSILFNEKKDSSMTYKRARGYQPGICTLNEDQVLYIENRSGNSDAKSFQHETLDRMFTQLEGQGVKKVDRFRADSASYQFKVIQLVEQHAESFYIGCPNRYVEKYFPEITEWKETEDITGSKIEIGEIEITPFQQQAKKHDCEAKPYRLVVKRKLNKTGQTNLFTQDDYDYRAVITNDRDLTKGAVTKTYYQRGNMEKQFDIMKNDFGWNNMPFSDLSQNTVFLYFMAICRNLYKLVVEEFSQRYEGLSSTYRLKKFIFRFVILPAKWVVQSRQKWLRIYSNRRFE